MTHKEVEAQRQAGKKHNSRMITAINKATGAKKAVRGSKQSKARGVGAMKDTTRQGEVIYHNCLAIAKYMRMRATKPKLQVPATQAQREQAANEISKQWRAHVLRQKEALGGRRRTAARLAELRPAEQKGKTNRKNTQSQKPQRVARKLFIGINVRTALERAQPMGSSWKSEWDYG